MLNQTCEVRFGCDNCGHEQVTDVPVRRRIVSYEPGDDDEEIPPTYSAYQRTDGEDYTFLLCDNCKMATLRVLWWDKEIQPVEVYHG